MLIISGLPDEDDLTKLSELIQEVIYKYIIKVVIRAGGAERHHNGAIWRPLQGNDIFVDLASIFWVNLQDVHIYYCPHRPRVNKRTLTEGCTIIT